jgi:hypothetical protein
MIFWVIIPRSPQFTDVSEKCEAFIVEVGEYIWQQVRATLPVAYLLLTGLLFYPEDGSDTLLRIVTELLTSYTAVYTEDNILCPVRVLRNSSATATG